MQSLSSRTVGWPKFFATKLRLPIAAAITTVLLIILSAGVQSESGASVGTSPPNCPNQLVQNAGFDVSGYPYSTAPLNWNTSSWTPSAQLVHDNTIRRSGFGSARITAATENDAWFWQAVTVEPNTVYLLTGWIKTENVSEGAGANLSLVGTWTHTEGLHGTNNWTRVSLWFKSGDSTLMFIGARLGYWSATSSGTAWFDDVRLTPMMPDGAHPSWKILVLIYKQTDAVVTDTAGVRHHMVGALTEAEVERATLAATQFVETDIPALTSGNMIPELTIRYPDHPLTQLDPYSYGWSPSPANTAADRDPAFDSVIVIWDQSVVDQYTGTPRWIAAAGGLAWPMGGGQTYAAFIMESAGRNIFKHEWGHSILFFFDATGASPKPAVSNHDDGTTYVHWPTGESYVWVDETDANPIPNSIYNNESGFTHDYYSGTIATADQPTRRLGITPEAWMLGGPVTKPIVPTGPPPVISCSGDIVAAKDPWSSSSAVLIPTRPTVSHECETNIVPVGTRSDGLPLDGPYPCGQTVITWTAKTSEDVSSSCQQVVTVTDGEAPAFIQIPPPVSVTTGPGATSCGAVVEDSRLVGTAGGSNPVVLDPTGDVRDPSSSRQNDIVSSKATFDRESLTLTVTFADKIFPASSDNNRRLTGFIEIDTDQNPGTGHHSIVHVAGGPYLNLGIDYRINLTSEARHPGFVEVDTDVSFDEIVTGTVPILFTDTSFTITVPLVSLGGDNGLVNYGIAVGVDSVATDRLPNGVEPAVSVAVPELIAIDNSAGVTVTRTGVPANNLFPIGETLITYTATDVNGNAASVTQSVTVVDDTPPVISQVRASPSTLWPPNRQVVDVAVNYEAVDNCAMLDTTLSVSSNEPGSLVGLDWEIVDAHHVRLRAQRSARSGDRIYTITINATDVQGNSSSQVVTVRVPRSMDGGIKVWDGAAP